MFFVTGNFVCLWRGINRIGCVTNCSSYKIKSMVWWMWKVTWTHSKWTNFYMWERRSRTWEFSNLEFESFFFVDFPWLLIKKLSFSPQVESQKFFFLNSHHLGYDLCEKCSKKQIFDDLEENSCNVCLSLSVKFKQVKQFCISKSPSKVLEVMKWMAFITTGE